jgi:hypothetical protein
MQAAEVIPIRPKVEVGYKQLPDVKERVKGDGRAIAAAKLRELADKLDSGELDGVRVQWLDTHGELLDAEGLPISGMEFVTRTAWRDDGSGTVQLRTVTIEEEG